MKKGTGSGRVACDACMLPQKQVNAAFDADGDMYGLMVYTGLYVLTHPAEASSDEAVDQLREDYVDASNYP